ncbi:MAG: hypothetical protein V7K78_03705 [Nostoc sp.]
MGETTPDASSRRSRRQVLQVGGAAQRTGSPTHWLPKTALPLLCGSFEKIEFEKHLSLNPSVLLFSDRIPITFLGEQNP